MKNQVQILQNQGYQTQKIDEEVKRKWGSECCKTLHTAGLGEMAKGKAASEAEIEASEVDRSMRSKQLVRQEDTEKKGRGQDVSKNRHLFR